MTCLRVILKIIKIIFVIFQNHLRKCVICNTTLDDLVSILSFGVYFREWTFGFLTMSKDLGRVALKFIQCVGFS